MLGKPYSELERLPAEAYLNPDNFRTGWDNASRGEQRYKEGLRTGQESTVIVLSYRGVWSAAGKNGGYTTSYEGIGYHGNTAELLRGFIDSGCPIDVQRWERDEKGEVTGKILVTRIK